MRTWRDLLLHVPRHLCALTISPPSPATRQRLRPTVLRIVRMRLPIYVIRSCHGRCDGAPDPRPHDGFDRAPDRHRDDPADRPATPRDFGDGLTHDAPGDPRRLTMTVAAATISPTVSMTRQRLGPAVPQIVCARLPAKVTTVLSRSPRPCPRPSRPSSRRRSGKTVRAGRWLRWLRIGGVVVTYPNGPEPLQPAPGHRGCAGLPAGTDPFAY